MELDRSGNNVVRRIPFEEALNKTGFGLYNLYHTCLSGLVIISFACIAYGTTIIVPTSACELKTTTSQQGLLTATPLIGSIFGALIWGYLGDTRGRRNMLMLSLFGAATINTLASISVHWSMLLVCQFIATLLASGMYPLAITLLSESVPLSKRNIVMLMVASIFLLSQGIMAVFAIPIIPLEFSWYISFLGIYWNSWRTVTVVYSLPSVISLIGLLAIKESPKFVLMKGNEKESLKILKHIYKFNLRSGNFQVLGLLPEESNKDKGKVKAVDQIVPLFRAPYLKYTIIMGLLFIFKQVNAFALWLPRIMDQYVTSLQSNEGSNMNLCGVINDALINPAVEEGNPCGLNETALLLVLAISGFQSVVNAFICVIVDRTGRRNMTIVLTFFIGVSGIIVNLVPNAVGSGIFFAFFLLGIMTVGLYTAMCVALFPTQLRAMAVSLTLTGGRIATFFSTQILNTMLSKGSCEASFYIFSVLFTLSAVAAAFLPDDRLLNKTQTDTELAMVEDEGKTKL